MNDWDQFEAADGERLTLPDTSLLASDAAEATSSELLGALLGGGLGNPFCAGARAAGPELDALKAAAAAATRPATGALSSEGYTTRRTTRHTSIASLHSTKGRRTVSAAAEGCGLFHPFTNGAAAASAGPAESAWCTADVAAALVPFVVPLPPFPNSSGRDAKYLSVAEEDGHHQSQSRLARWGNAIQG